MGLNGLFLCDSDIKTCFIEFYAKMRFNGMQYACVKKKFNLTDSEHMQNWPSGLSHKRNSTIDTSQ